MAFFEFPHTRTYDSDLAWLIKAYKILTGKVNNIEQTIEDTINDALQGEELKQLITQMIAEALPLNVKYPPAESGLTPAVGDGETDDTAALQAMIAYANANNMPMIFPSGVYRVTGLNVNVDTVFQGFHSTLMLAPVSAKPLITLTADLATSGLTLNANLGGQTTAQNAINIVNGSFAITNTTIMGGKSCIEGTLVGDSMIGDSYLRDFQEYGIHAEGSGSFTASNVVVPSVASGGAMRFMRIDCNNCTVSNFSSAATVPIGFEITGNNNAITANTPNVETTVNDGGQNNNWKAIGKSEKRFFNGTATHVYENLSETVTRDFKASYSDSVINHNQKEENVSGNSETTVGGNSSENVSGTKSVTANDIKLTPSNPLEYDKTPTPINNYFSYVPFKNANGDYNVLVAGDDLETLTTQNLVVNVIDFGADNSYIYYDKEQNAYFADALFTEKPNSSVEAFENAIVFAQNHNIHTIFIPSGWYYLPNKTFELEEESVTFLGEGNSFLVSENLSESTSFITVNATNDIQKYQSSPVVISGICILGNYFKNDLSYNGVTALSFGTAWVQKRKIQNVGISLFNVGMKFIAAVETHINGCSVMACDTGIYFSETSSGYNPVPCFFESGVIELNGRGIYAPNGGFSVLFISNSGISGGRQLYYGKTLLYINNCRHEVALDALCDNNGSPMATIICNGTETSDADVGLIMNNVEVLTTSSGYWDGLDLFVNATHYTRSSDINYLWEIYNPYSNLNVAAELNNISYNNGDKGVSYLLRCQGNNIMSSNLRTVFYNAKSVGTGRFFIDNTNISSFSENISVNDDINVSSTTTITLNLNHMDTAVISHIVGNFSYNVIHKYYIGDTIIYTETLTPDSSSNFGYNMTSKVPKGSDHMTIEIASGAYNLDFWIEII